MRHREGHDGATPSANAVAAARPRAAVVPPRPRRPARGGASGAIRRLRQARSRASRARSPRAWPWSTCCWKGPSELAFVGAPARARPRGAAPRGRRGTTCPTASSRTTTRRAGPSPLPLLAGKGLVDGRAALYVCRDFACQAAGHGAGGRRGRAVRRTPPAGRRAPATLARSPARRATAEGTARLRGALRPGAARATRRSGSTGLVCSRIGFGGYRVDDETPEHRAGAGAGARAAAATSSTPRRTTPTAAASASSARSLRGAGRATATLRREEVVVVSKIGYVQGENLRARAASARRDGQPFPEMVQVRRGRLALHPSRSSWRDQLARSLERLGLETLDVCLLHNPEYFLTDAHERSHGTLEKRREEFYRAARARRSRSSRREVRGRPHPAAYGVSSNTVTSARGRPRGHVARRACSRRRASRRRGHHFRVLQLPLNLFEAGAALERNNGAGPRRPCSRCAAAARHRRAREPPAQRRGRESGHGAPGRRLPSLQAGPRRLGDAAASASAALEDGVPRATSRACIQTADGSLPATQFFRWAHDLRGVDAHVNEPRALGPARGPAHPAARRRRACRRSTRPSSGALAEQWRDWRGRYLPELQALLAELRGRAAAKSARSVRDRCAASLDPVAARRSAAARRCRARRCGWLASTPGVSVGAHRHAPRTYVDDALAVLAWPPLPTPGACRGDARVPARTSEWTDRWRSCLPCVEVGPEARRGGRGRVAARPGRRRPRLRAHRAAAAACPRVRFVFPHAPPRAGDHQRRDGHARLVRHRLPGRPTGRRAARRTCASRRSSWRPLLAREQQARRALGAHRPGRLQPGRAPWPSTRAPATAARCAGSWS